MTNKHESRSFSDQRAKRTATLVRMYAVAPEEGFLDDTIATFKCEGEAERFRRMNQQFWKVAIVVVPVMVTLDLVMEEDDG